MFFVNRMNLSQYLKLYKFSERKWGNMLIKVGGVGGCAKLDFFRQILYIYNYLGCEKTLALQSPKTKQIYQQTYSQGI